MSCLLFKKVENHNNNNNKRNPRKLYLFSVCSDGKTWFICWSMAEQRNGTKRQILTALLNNCRLSSGEGLYTALIRGIRVRCEIMPPDRPRWMLIYVRRGVVKCFSAKRWNAAIDSFQQIYDGIRWVESTPCLSNIGLQHNVTSHLRSDESGHKIKDDIF